MKRCLSYFSCASLIIAVLGSSAPAADRWAFDFGSAKSPVWKGFTQVTPVDHYSPERGYGWKEPFPAPDSGETHPVRRGGVTADPDDLACDYVFHAGPFCVDVAPGRYVAAVMVGYIGHGLYFPNRTYSITAQGKPAVVVEINAENFYRNYYFRNQNWEYTPETDVFDELIAPRLPWHTFDVEAPDGQIKLAVNGLGVLALLIRPAGERERFQADLAALNEARKRQFYGEVFSLLWTEPKEPKEPKPTPTEAERRAGCILFTRNIKDVYNEKVSPRTRPRPEELRPEAVAMTAARGEYESRGLSVYPIEKLAEANLELVGDLVGESGRIPRSAVSVRRITYGLYGNRRTGLRNCMVHPWILRQATPQTLHPEWSIPYWITVRVPEDTPAGLYGGTLRFRATNRPGVEIPLRVRVLPFTLRDNPDVLRGFFYHGPRDYKRLGYYEQVKERYWEAVEWDLRLMKAYGFNAIEGRGFTAVTVKDDKVHVDFVEADRFWDLYRKVGIQGRAICSDGNVGTGPLAGQRPFRLPDALPYRSDRERDLLKETIALFRDHALEARWPGAPDPLIFWCTDELGGGQNVDQAIDLLKIYREVPGIRTYSTINGADEFRLLPYLDIISPNIGIDITPEILERIEQAGCRIGFYNLGGTRFAFGPFLWRTGGAVLLEWHWNSTAQDPFCSLDGPGPDYGYAYLTESDVLPTYALEALREGVDDFRYLTTLDQMIEEVRRLERPSAQEAVAQAEETRAMLREAITVEAAMVAYKVAEWQPEAYDRMREVVVEAISCLVAARGADPSSNVAILTPAPAQRATWWNKSFAYRLPVRVNAGAHSRHRPIVAAMVDFPALLPKGRIDRGSVRLVSETADGPSEVPSACEWLEDGRCQVRWRIPEDLPPFASRRFHLYFDTTDHAPKAPADYGPIDRGAVESQMSNLVRNGGFEELDPQHLSLPLGWDIEGTAKEREATVAVVEDCVRSGRRAVRLETAPGAKPVSLIQDLGKIKPNTRYVLSFWGRISQAGDGPSWILGDVSINRTDGSKWNLSKYLSGTKVEWTRSMRSFVPVGTAHIFETPDDVTTGHLRISVGNSTRTAYVDEVAFEEVSPGGKVPMPVRLGRAESRPLN